MAPVTVLQANLATICFSSALYGVFFVLTVTSLAITIRRHKEESIGAVPTSAAKKPKFRFVGPWGSPLFVATIVLLLVISADWIVTLARFFKAFFNLESGSNPTAYYSDFSQPTAIALNALTVMAVLVCDLMLIYRTWIIWNRRYWVAVLPLVTTIALTAVSIAITYLYSALTPQRAAALTHFITGGCILTLSTNFYCTGMIVYRLVSANRRMSGHAVHDSGHRSILKAMSIFVESAALYAAWTLFFFVEFQVGSAISSFANACMPFVSGISLSLITVRVALGWANRSRSNELSAGESVGNGFQVSGSLNRRADAYPLRAINLNVSTTVEQETDFAIHGQDKTRIQF
ncbi:hypothetical protein L226DRAFT_569675 [Lentinus tigrinus ALCF2SS1-7]|uniref:Uncharacterized protein n=1 Tax=Lentinus tigrinus ALCF2SS1-6 TaxID=1328759 RepID=A0A5C2SLN0_9APHY|nr:hypothetical protein L227DRAFT_607898 [Lentinus tigrinus ALCF2SS1-6]RPD76407.1 hypothetical protein L226DRAFT_569675 [Lentinus tigrinus ALCF2SS1-7]